MTVVSGHIHVSYGQYYLMGIHFDTDEWDPAEGNGLIFLPRRTGGPSRSGPVRHHPHRHQRRTDPTDAGTEAGPASQLGFR